MTRRLDVALCRGCLSKMREIDRLKHKVERQRRYIAGLEKKLNAVPRTINEAPFGSSTPSSKLPLKPGANETNLSKKGGARPGHRGHGRRTPVEPDITEQVPVPLCCPDCGCPVSVERTRERHVQHIVPQHTIRKRLLVQAGRCTGCGKSIEAQVSGVLPHAKYTNAFQATVACQHYLGGRTQGDVCRQAQIGSGAFNNAMHTLADRLQPCLPILQERFLLDGVRFGDETSWREDGANRYAWLLSTVDVSLFLVGRTRATEVPMELFSEMTRLGLIVNGVLVVDRYAAYGRLPVQLQYCYAHLLRDVEKLHKDFPGDMEVDRFCRALAPLLAKAMGLRGRKISDQRYYQQAQSLRQRIVEVCASQAKHAGVQAMQDIFRRHQNRLYHWVDDRRIPADNNYSERNLRPLVIARKLSFGSQSPRGARTRGILMSVLHSLAKQGHDPAARLTEALDRLVHDPAFDMAAFLFPPRPPPPPIRQPQSAAA